MRLILSLIVRSICVMFALASFSSVNGQISIMANGADPTDYASLTNFSIVNSGGVVLNVSISIDLSEIDGNREIFTVFVASANVAPGQTPFASVSAASSIRFYSNSISNYLRNNDQLPDGNYRVCYTVSILKDATGDANLCKTFSKRNSSPLMLVAPADRSELCDERPTFQWINPTPLPVGSTIRFLLVEIKEGQSSAEAIYRNIPLVNIPDAGTTGIMPLPSFVESLSEDVTYAWQIIIYNSKGVVQRSEIWTFKKECVNVHAIKKEGAFPQLTRSGELSIYLVKDVIRFSFINSYNNDKLDYSIIDANTNKVIRHFPEVYIRIGLNQIEIDVDDCDGLRRGRYYIVQVRNVQNMPLQMKFRYEK